MKTKINSILFIICSALLFSNCSNNAEKLTRLETTNDSLRAALKTSQEMLYTLRDIGSLIDSIDSHRKALRVNVIEGTPLNNFKARMEELKNYVKRSEQKIAELQTSLQAANTDSEAYQMMIAALKDELTISADDITRLEKRVSNLTKDNNDLNQTVKVQQASLEDFQLQLDAKYEEVKLFEVRIQELTNRLQITEAEAYFAQAQALELAAKRTHLAPNKKKETYKQALDLYKKSLAAGNEEARNRITSLQTLI